MPSERVQRRIDALLDEAEEAADRQDWQAVSDAAERVLSADPENEDAKIFIGMASSGAGVTSPAPELSETIPPRASVAETSDTPTSFANGRYQVSKFLGEGGKKRVYQAHDTLLDRDVAFALIKTEGFDQTSRERISREAQAMGRLGTHPNIVTVFDLGTEGESPFMVTELMGGGDVEGLLEDAEDNRLSLEQTIEMGKAICEGLQFAHSQGVIHRDIKPGNVWLTTDGIAKIGDFGLAVMTDRSRLTREGMMVGTVSYMPPEQATGGEITPKADLYSLGAMLYEMVTGRPPFLGDDEIAIIGQHINTPPVAPTWHNGDCPRPLEALIMRLLSKDPSERPDSAQDVFNALDAIDLTARGQTVEQDQTSLDSLAGGVFVGRQREMDQLKGALEDVLGGRGRLITLVGEPGIGKTRTCEELATYAGLRGAQVLWGRCYETGGQPPYWPWVQAIRSYVREIDPDELRRQMGSSASVVAEIVTDVKDRLPDLQPPPRLDDPDSARFRLFDSIASFLKTASQARPLVIVLDDLHWSDQPSLAFLEFMARELGQSRVMLICTYRDMELNRRHPLTVTLGDLARERLYERVLLRGLSEQDVARFIEIAAGIDPPAGLSATVYRHTEGNPLFVTEVVRELVQSGELTPARMRGVSTWSVRIPEGVREVIGRRLDRLSDRTNETLTIAAVIGRQFALNALRVIVEDTTESQLLDVLDEALAARVIEELPSSAGDYQFTHALIQETYNGELSAARQVRLHARIAVALEESYGETADDHASELAPHFAEAEPVLGAEKLIHYSAVAGRRALDAFAYEAAAEYLGAAASSMEGSPMSADSAAVLSQLGIAQVAVRDEPGAAGSLTRAFDYYADNGMIREAIEIAARPHNVSMLRLMEPVIRRAVELTAEDSHDRGRLLVPFGWIAFMADQPEAANRSLTEAVGLARRHEDPVLEMRALAMQANVSGFNFRYDDALKAASAALDLAKTHHEPETEMRARLWYTMGLMATGRLEEGEKAARDFLEAAVNLGHGVWISRAVAPFITIAMLKGDWDAARATSESIARHAPADAALISVSVGLWTGDSGAARSAWDTYLSLIPRVIDEQGVPLLPVGIGASALLPVEALEIIDRSDELADQIRRSYQASEHLFPVTDIPVLRALRMRCPFHAGRREEVRALYESLVEVTKGTEISALGVGPLMLGRTALLIGEPDRALGHYDHATDIYRKYEYRAGLAGSLAGAAAALRERGDEGDVAGAEEREDEALTITQELGMRPLTERILARREILRA
ncbi:MAG: protein kinase [Chloroflexi bacterium]|nr:protein kinase [Chloroflexota bacterium]